MRFLLAALGTVVFTACAAQPQAPAEPAAEAKAPANSARAGAFFIHLSGRSQPADPDSQRHDPDRDGYAHRRRRRADRDGRITAVGQSLSAPSGAQVIDASGRWVTPGLIDVHSHMGASASPGVDAHRDGNESTDPVTANVWVEHSVWPQDPGFESAIHGGVTSLQILPGSANLIGGRGVTLKNIPATTYQAMKFPGAPQGLKMACGENPKRGYGDDDQFPKTRMGNVAGYRQAFADAKDYMEDWKEYDAELAQYEKKKAAEDEDALPPKPPKQDLELETLAEVMRGNILVHNHCYRADEMATMLDIAQEFGYRISTFHHGAEAYKLADRLAAEGVCGGLWADWWGFKMEAYDGIQENLAIVDHPAGRLRHRALRLRRGRPATEPGSREGDDARHTRGLRHPAGARDPLDHGECREGARHPRPDRNARARKDGGRRRLEWHAVQRVRARGPGVRGRRAALRSLEARGQARGRISRCEEALRSSRLSRCWCPRSAMPRIS